MNWNTITSTDWINFTTESWLTVASVSIPSTPVIIEFNEITCKVYIVNTALISDITKINTVNCVITERSNKIYTDISIH